MTGLCALAFVYLSARRALSEGAVRKVLGWIGSIAILPVAGLTAVVAAGRHTHHEDVIGWTIAAGVPLALALWLGRKEAWRPAIAVAWTFLLALIGPDQEVLVYAWCGLGGIALAAWGACHTRCVAFT